jgi:hypothetical protein
MEEMEKKNEIALIVHTVISTSFAFCIAVVVVVVASLSLTP